MKDFVETDLTVNELRKLFYFCYSPKQKAFFTQNGMEYVLKGINDQTGKTFWAFGRTKELTPLLKEWKNSSPSYN